MGEIDEASFQRFAAWFQDPAIAGRDADVADMLATQFGDVNWAAAGDLAGCKDVMARRLEDKDPARQDTEDLLQKFHGYTSPGSDDPQAAGQLVAWLAGKMREHGWDTHTVPEYDPAAGTRYRYDTAAGVYQWEDPASGRWLSEEDSARLQALTGGEVPEDQRFSDPEFDDSSYLWYRYDNGTGTYQWAEASPEQGPDKTAAWLTGTEAAERRRYSAPQVDTRTGTRYRFDNQDRVYQWEDPGAQHAWLSEAEFTARAAKPAAAAGAGQYSMPVFDPNYGMWYRYHEATRTYEWAVGDPAAEPGPTATWMTQTQADQYRSAQSAPPGPAAAGEDSMRLVPEITQLVAEAAGIVMARLLDEDAFAGIDPGELAPGSPLEQELLDDFTEAAKAALLEPGS